MVTHKLIERFWLKLFKTKSLLRVWKACWMIKQKLPLNPFQNCDHLSNTRIAGGGSAPPPPSRYLAGLVILYVYTSVSLIPLYCSFVWLLLNVLLENISLRWIRWRRHHWRYRAAKFWSILDNHSAFKFKGIYIVQDLLWHGASVIKVSSEWLPSFSRPLRRARGTETYSNPGSTGIYL